MARTMATPARERMDHRGPPRDGSLTRPAERSEAAFVAPARERFVKGHGFSRAVSTRALPPPRMGGTPLPRGLIPLTAKCLTSVHGRATPRHMGNCPKWSLYGRKNPHEKDDHQEKDC